jgi:hypothetical protein
MSKLTKKERLLHSLIGIKQLFNDLGVEDLKNEIVLKDGTTETIDCYKEIETFVVDFINNEVDEATPKNPILSKAWKVKMTAKEMFEELGFYITIYNDGEIIIWTNRDIDCKISFYEHDKEYGVFGCCYINLEIHNAITTQLKELGWI